MEDEPTPTAAEPEEGSPSDVPPFDPDPRLITKLERGRRENERETIRHRILRIRRRSG
ncbi:MAG: hypothetical protein ACRDHB_09125 [Actinomycetota bacterium]